MNEIDKAIKALQQLRDATAVRVEKAEKEARAARELLTKLDQSIVPLVATGAGLRMPVKSVAGKPAVMSDVYLRDTAAYALADKDLDFSFEALVSHNELAASLSNPATRARNLKNIWEQNLAALLDLYDAQQKNVHGKTFAGENDALKIAEGSAYQSGLGLTTVNARNTAGTDTVSLHILLNGKSGKALVVGEKIPSRLREAFKKANVNYVDRTSPDAKAQTERALADVIGSLAREPFLRNRLLEAFKYRNGYEDEKENAKVTDLASALVDPKMKSIYPKYVVRMK